MWKTFNYLDVRELYAALIVAFEEDINRNPPRPIRKILIIYFCSVRSDVAEEKWSAMSIV